MVIIVCTITFFLSLRNGGNSGGHWKKIVEVEADIKSIKDGQRDRGTLFTEEEKQFLLLYNGLLLELRKKEERLAAAAAAAAAAGKLLFLFLLW